jgi:hypothetical protein
MSRLSRNIETLIEAYNLPSLLATLGDAKGKEAIAYGKLLSKLSGAMKASFLIQGFEYKKDIQDISNAVSAIAKNKGKDFFDAVELVYRKTEREEK